MRLLFVALVLITAYVARVQGAVACACNPPAMQARKKKSQRARRSKHHSGRLPDLQAALAGGQHFAGV